MIQTLNLNGACCSAVAMITQFQQMFWCAPAAVTRVTNFEYCFCCSVLQLIYIQASVWQFPRRVLFSMLQSQIFRSWMVSHSKESPFQNVSCGQEVDALLKRAKESRPWMLILFWRARAHNRAARNLRETRWSPGIQWFTERRRWGNVHGYNVNPFINWSVGKHPAASIIIMRALFAPKVDYDTHPLRPQLEARTSKKPVSFGMLSNLVNHIWRVLSDALSKNGLKAEQ